MRWIKGILCAAMVTGSALAGTGITLIDPDDGTYKTVPVTSSEACMDLCKQDDKCRGAITYQPDTRYPDMQCRLNDGMSGTSPFEVTPPEPLDLTVALRDFNAYRVEHGLAPVSLNTKLIAASEAHAQDLAETGRAAHEGSDGSTHAQRLSLTGYQYALVAENVATGQESWDIVFRAWQDSSGHNENLLQPDVTDFGVALVYEPTTKYITYWAMLVAEPLGFSTR